MTTIEFDFYVCFIYLQCPQCNKMCKVKDIRTLYVSRIAAVDGEMLQVSCLRYFPLFSLALLLDEE
jgi:hypothetical protein